MTPIAIIGGSGLYEIEGFECAEVIDAGTRWGQPSAAIVRGTFGKAEVLFLARHGKPHRIPPHQVNYRANLQALYDIGARQVIAVNAVGGIHQEMGPESIVVPDQVIDYSYGREHTFFAEGLQEVTHVDFSSPYTESLRQQLISAASRIRVPMMASAVYGCTQGPRLESAAEIDRLERDGVDLVGMTGMPEAGLARELSMEYAALALVVNWAAGRTEEPISMDEIYRVIGLGMSNIISILREAVNS